MTNFNLTKNQRRVLRQALRSGGETFCARTVANQLVKRGLVERTGETYERRSWNRVEARLTVVRLTRFGQLTAEMLQAQLDGKNDETDTESEE